MLYCLAAGEEKAKFHWTKVALLAIIAGMYCGFGFTLCVIIGGNAPRAWLEEAPGLFNLVYGAVGFPFSFTMVGHPEKFC
jgi:formate/nitrite transporter FocA (FNT family)